MELAPLFLKKNEERRIRGGHLWVYSNEVDIVRSPLNSFESGQQVLITASSGKPLGTGYVNPRTLICARLVSRDPREPLGPPLLDNRLETALALRERLYPLPYYRLVHGEGDGLPGLVVDRFGDVLVAQLNTAGMDAAREAVVSALDRVLRPRGILLRNDSPLRGVEGLEPLVEEAFGEVPETLEVRENGCHFQVAAGRSQKTGWYFDHRENRARLQRYAAGARVLDLFSYLGAWGIEALTAGAASATLVETSASAQEQAGRNALHNECADRVTRLTGDVFDTLRQLRGERQRFDLVVVDPPAFIKRRKDLKRGLEAYHRLNRMAIQVLERGGLLVSASCSFHLDRDRFRGVLLSAARHLDRGLQILEQGHQAPDHPVHPAIPETDYIKCFFTRVLAA